MYNAKEWRSRKTYDGKGNNSNENEGIGYRKKIRIFKDDYKRRMKMFEALVGSITLCGAEM